MGGASSSYTSSEQSAQAFLSQQFSGSCDISCTNRQDNVNVDIINSIIGGDISLTQTCSVNSSCMVSGSSDAASDVLFKAANSSNAKDTGGLFSGSLFNIDSAVSMSRQDIKQTILQSTSESCKMSSLNEMNNITILAANSVIGGSIKIGQTGSVSGQCKLGSNMSAAATATAMASNTATSGKDKKGSSGMMYMIVGVVIVMAVTYVFAKMYTGNVATEEQEAKIKDVESARAKAGCPGGVGAIKGDDGEFVIDPLTRRPICPPADIKPVAPTMNFDFGNLLKKKTPAKRRRF